MITLSQRALSRNRRTPVTADAAIGGHLLAELALALPSFTAERLAARVVPTHPDDVRPSPAKRFLDRHGAALEKAELN